MFEEYGYEAVTMERIAVEGDVAKATLYSYFPMKEALVAHHLRDEIVEGMAALADQLATHRSFVSRMQFLLRESAAWHAAKRAYLPPYLRYLHGIADSAENGAIQDAGSTVTWNALTAMFRAAQQGSEVARAIPAEQLAWSLQYLLYGAVTHWLLYPDTDLTAAFLQAFALLMNGAAANKPGDARKSISTGKTNPRRSR
ncbi:TetR/AcrR family transcriptional regulator [Rhodanobacter sp. 7MK24]|uniref:TetR/AcrR family transcriptional regulator n=1 Tax=Rhodanobacter sp. 7MK24 TaxID=2775922 RepID=UPI001CE10E91|nr:TetR/AcrR family transcriptional regulator [Rhodanobacter sp. 7MK24]